MDKKIWTVGHSNKTFEEFLQMLQQFEIKILADVRRYPGSAKYPHFNKNFMEKSLKASEIEYVHLPELGGRRKPLVNSKNTAWRNEAFKGYADFMETDEFDRGLQRLLASIKIGRTAMMCSEALWWRCHRSLIADWLKAKDFEVVHIMGKDKLQEHPFTGAAKIVDGRLSYELDVE